MVDIHNPSAWDRICSYLLRDPLIYLYTIVLGTASLFVLALRKQRPPAAMVRAGLGVARS